MARKKRSLHGTYSPQNEEFKAPIIEMTDILKVPDERFKERLIWGELMKIANAHTTINNFINIRWKWNKQKLQWYKIMNLYCIDIKISETYLNWSFSISMKVTKTNRENAPQKILKRYLWLNILFWTKNYITFCACYEKLYFKYHWK